MQHFFSTLKLTSIFLSLLIVIGWSSVTAFSQQEIDLNHILSSEDHNMKGLFHMETNNHFDKNHKEKKIIILTEGQEIPSNIQQEIIAMGLDFKSVKKQFNGAKQSIKIVKPAGEKAFIEVDSDDLKGYHRINGGQAFGDMEQFLNNESFNFELKEGMKHFFNTDAEKFKNGEPQIRMYENGEIPQDLQNKLDQLGFDNLNLDNHKRSWDCGSAIKKTVKPYLGVLARSHSNEGVVIDKVMENSAAKEAGLKKDDVIQSIDGEKVISSYDFIQNIKAHKPGDQIRIKLLRDGKAKTIKATLKSKPIRSCENFEKGGTPEFRVLQDRARRYTSSEDCKTLCEKPMLGVMIDNYNHTLNGVHINKVFENSGAKKAGLQIDDIITKIDKTPVANTDELIAKIQTYEPGDNVMVTLRRQGRILNIKSQLTNKVALRAYSSCDCDQPDYKAEADKEIIIIKKALATTPEVESVKPTAPRSVKPIIKQSLIVDAVALYPNPNSGIFTIDFALENIAPVQLTIVDVSGKEVYRKEIPEFNGNFSEKIDVSRHSKGTYFLNIIQEGDVYTQTFIYGD